MDPFDIDWSSVLAEGIPGIKPIEPYMPLKNVLLANKYEFWEERHSPKGVKLTCTSPLGGEVRVDYEKQIIGKDTHLYLTKIVIRSPITSGEKVTPTEIVIEPDDTLLDIENYILPLLHNGQTGVR